MTLRLRVALLGMAVVLVVLCCFSVSLFGLLSRGIGADRDAQLAERADAAATSLAAADATALRPTRVPAPVDPATSVEVFVMVLDADGTAIVSTGEIGGAPPQLPASVLAAAAADGGPVTVTASGQSLRLAVRAWQRPDLDRRGFVVAAQSGRKTVQDVGGLIFFFVLATLVALVAAAAALWVVTGRAARTLRRTEEMAARMEAALAAQQRFTADASHELRTPLTTLRYNAEFLLQHPDARAPDRQAALRDIAGESERMGRLVEQLLTLARADAGAHLLRSDPVNLADAAAEVCRQAATLHPTRRIDFAGTPARPVEGDADALRQLLWILVDNAVKFTADGGTVWVTVTQRGAAVQVHVADDGVGVPDGEAQRIFARFHRVDAARSGGGGAGLGLAIADWIVREHGGHIVVANNDRGGATFTVELPGTDATVSLPAAPGAPIKD
jgi:signal transduction histidine kinase